MGGTQAAGAGSPGRRRPRVIKPDHRLLPGHLQKLGLNHPDVIDHFKLCFANRTLGLRLPVTSCWRLAAFSESSSLYFSEFFPIAPCVLPPRPFILSLHSPTRNPVC